ncbi:hypothetical protein RJ639_010850 [Escallonia herrerae]|uniref:Uncharacterized protein n=1 Tax=Escallonia herrerae TaxID=1293975 RepID=A0AA88VSJ5_9ASTE|nr:hypothetical protein RJ639_010850 [Escallonia herrerae]
MWLGGGNGVAKTLVRHFSRKCAPNLRKINPKVPPQEAASIAQGLYHLIKHNGPLSVSNTWNHAKESGISGLNSKTHMKIMLKWMRGRKMLKLLCNHVGSSKKFLHCTLPVEPQTDQSSNFLELQLQTEKPPMKRKKQIR